MNTREKQEAFVKELARKQHQIILLSILYYEYLYSWVSDFRYDELSKELAKFQADLPVEVCEQSEYWYVFFDFEGSTGFYLTGRLSKRHKELLIAAAQDVLYNEGISY